MKRFPKFSSWVSLITVLLVVGWFFNITIAGNEELYYKIDKGLYNLKEVFEILNRHYVDKLDPEGVSKAAINGMVKELDPYTVYFEDPGSERMGMITRGKYGGLGMEIGIQNGKITVIAPMEDTPAKRAGILAGDVITKIDGESTEDMTIEEASRRLRGKIGTQVTLEIQRPGVDEPITLTLTREEIVVKDVTFADFIDSGTVLIRLSGFTEKAPREMKEAILALKRRGKIERVILDLRGNPGGLLSSAVEVANIFLPPGELVVSTRGRNERESKYFTKEMPLLPNVPLAVLVNQYSASASEIVSGAIQDLDRGIIVGTTTFGKGLVQKVFPIDKINQTYLKITTAKYYTPSGRLIQKEDYKKNHEIFVDLSDSVEYNKKVNYYTKNGRVVHGGGGIVPDVTVEGEKLDRFIAAVRSRGYLFRFTVDYLSRHPELKQQSHITVTDAMLNDFAAYLKEQGFDFELPGEENLEKFLEIAGEKQYDEDIRDLVKVALQKLDAQKQNAVQAHAEQLKRQLEAEFAEKIGGSRARLATYYQYDNQLKKALQILKDLPEYNQILAVQKNR